MKSVLRHRARAPESRRVGISAARRRIMLNLFYDLDMSCAARAIVDRVELAIACIRTQNSVTRKALARNARNTGPATCSVPRVAAEQRRCQVITRLFLVQ